MIERLEKLIGLLDQKRDSLLESYISSLEKNVENPEWKDGSMGIIENAALIHDLDKHITNMHMEIKRIQALKVVANA